MTPLHLEILLHYYCKADQWAFLTDTHSDYADNLQDGGLLKGLHVHTYEITDKGRFYIHHLLHTPFPETQFIIPEHTI